MPGARSPTSRSMPIRPNPKQPRTVFDEDDMAELVHSIREIGVLQPIVVRPVEDADGGGPAYELIMGERRWRAPRQPATTLCRPSSGHPGRRDAARRTAGEPAPVAAQRPGGSCCLPAVAGRLRVYAGGACRPDRAQPAPGVPTPFGCSNCRRSSRGGWPPASCRPVMPGRSSAYRTGRPWNGWLSASSPRGCRSGRRRDRRRWQRRGQASPGAPPGRRPAPTMDDLAAGSPIGWIPGSGSTSASGAAR